MGPYIIKLGVMGKGVTVFAANIDARLLTLVIVCLLATGNTSHAACNIVDGKGYGDCAGVRINEGIKGQITVRSSTSQSGIIEGAAVLKGGDLHLSGISNGDITVHHGGRFVLTGVVNGTVRNLGGKVEIEGMLDRLHTTGGQVVIGGNVGSVSGTGPIGYKMGAVVGGVPVEKTVQKVGNQ